MAAKEYTADERLLLDAYGHSGDPTLFPTERVRRYLEDATDNEYILSVRKILLDHPETDVNQKTMIVAGADAFVTMLREVAGKPVNLVDYARSAYEQVVTGSGVSREKIGEHKFLLGQNLFYAGFTGMADLLTKK